MAETTEQELDDVFRIDPEGRIFCAGECIGDETDEEEG
jgi:hypothetical protein